MKSYSIIRKAGAPPVNFNWEDAYWQDCETADVDIVRPESSDHHPKVQVKVAHDGRNIYGIYQVHDRYVRAVARHFQDQVCLDSCVEFFFKPSAGPGYFNLEMSAGSAFLMYYVRDNTPKGEGYADMVELPWEDGQKVKVNTSLPKRIDPEITEPLVWQAQFAIPVEMIEKYTGPVGDLSGQHWTGNFYKCADKTSHPHWLSWSSVSALNFHLPECFGNWFFK